jgi:hypothetical protein
MAEGEWVELCSVPLAEARRVVARLEEAMLPFTLPAGEDGPAMDAEGRVAVFVLAEDLEVAREVVFGEAVGDDEAPADARRELEERAVADWVCPRCGRRALEAIPLTRAARRVLQAGLIASALPLVVAAAAAALPEVGALRHAPGPWGAMWILMVGWAALAAVFAGERGRRCAACGWASG